MHFVALDAWRGIAALVVASVRIDTNGVIYALPFVRHSYLFVDFFFVLSGFVIAHAYGTRVRSGLDALIFMVRRFGRLWPLHVALLVPFVAFEAARFAGWSGVGEAPFSGLREPWTLIFDVTLTQSLGISGQTGWNTPAWSISTEFWTYLIFAGLCLTVRGRLMLPAAIGAGAALLVVMSGATRGMDTSFDLGLFRCLAGFLAGVVVQRLWSSSEARVRPVLARLPGLEIAVSVLAFTFVSLAGHGPWSFAAPAVFGLVVYVFAFEAGALSRLLTTKPFEVLGRLSYSIYMTALLVSLVVERAVVGLGRVFGRDVSWTSVIDGHSFAGFDLGSALANDLVVIAHLVLVVALSALTYRLVETPGRNLFNRLAERLRPSAPEVGSPPLQPALRRQFRDRSTPSVPSRERLPGG